MEGSSENASSTFKLKFSAVGGPRDLELEGEEEAEEDEEHGQIDYRGRRKTTSLRKWLDRPGRTVEMVECVHVFRQIAEAVSLAHSQGVVVRNVRPSCFVMSALTRIAFIESASSSSDDGGENGDTVVQVGSEASCNAERKEFDGDRKDFPLKRILQMEMNWYTSPEEEAGGSSNFASDIYRLGVLLFELFCTCESLDERLRTMSNMRHRVLPPHLLLKWPKVASFCLWLLHPQPEMRPKMSEVLQSEFLNERRDSLEEREAAIKLREEIEDQELLLEFLLMLRQRKQELANKLQDTICFLSSDIEEVVNQQSVLVKKSSSYVELENAEDSAVIKEDEPLSYPVFSEDSACSVSKKRLRSGLQHYSEHDLKGKCTKDPRSGVHSEIQEKVLSKSSRLMKNFKNFEAAYFSTRNRMTKQQDKATNPKLPVTSTVGGSIVRTEGSSVEDFASKANRSGWISPFLEGLCKYHAFSKLKVRADLKQGDMLNSSNLVCSLAFDRDNEYFASAGVNRKIKIFEWDMVLNNDRDIHYPVVEMASRSKLSSICWNSYIKSQIASSDFEGVVQVWDVSRNQVLVDMKEHERRVWAVDFSLADPTKLASGSDDGTVKLWNINQAGSIGTIRTKANVCSVQFPPDSARSLVVGSADHKVYCFDLRNLKVPWCTLVGHTKTVSYVKFVDSSTLVSASTDSSLKIWDLSTCSSRVLDSPLQTFSGHTNVKNFVGLSISDGYIATGSETNEIFVYHKAFPMPVLSYKFNNKDPISGQVVDDVAQFISCVCWHDRSSTLVAASSSGNIKILEMV